MQPRTLVILLIIIPTLASNGAYLLSAYEGFVPWCMPYLDGCTTISRAGRSGNSIFIYRVLVITYSVLLIWFWIYSKNWLELLHGHATKMAHVILWLGLAGAISLLIYIDFLGATGEFNRFMRRFGVLIYFTFTPLAQWLLLKQHYDILNRKPEFSKNQMVLQYQLFIVVLMLITGAISFFLVMTDNNTYARENIAEWNFSLLLTLYFAGMIFLWKDYTHAFTIRVAKNRLRRN